MPQRATPVPPPNTPPDLDVFGRPQAPINYRGVDLSSQQWPDLVLYMPDFSDANLSDVDMPNLHTTSGRFDRADCSDAKLRGSSFVSGRFEETDMRRANLDGARFSSFSRLRRVQFVEATLGHVRMEGSVLVEDCDLSSADANALTVLTSTLRNSVFRQAFLPSADFTGVAIEGCNFEGAYMPSATFSRQTSISDCDFSGAVLVGAWFDPQVVVSDTTNFRGADIAHTEMPASLRAQLTAGGAVCRSQ